LEEKGPDALEVAEKKNEEGQEIAKKEVTP